VTPRSGSVVEQTVETEEETPRFIELGVAGDRGDFELQSRIAQGVSKRREQTK